MKKILVLFLANSCVSIPYIIAYPIDSSVYALTFITYREMFSYMSSGQLPGLVYKRVSVPLTYVQDESENSADIKIKTKNKSSNLDIREGRGCAQSIMGLVAIGDGSIETAKRQGNIKKVSSVSTEITSVLGYFAQSCTIVSGY